MVGIATILGRQFSFNHGHFKINPNLYVMLVGSPGTRKTGSINIMRNILNESGYETIAADRSTKEKFLLDLSEGSFNKDTDDILDKNLFGNLCNDDDYAEMLIAADEFNDFIGINNVDFLSLLGIFWDYDRVYKSRIKTGAQVNVNKPTINILAGNTTVGISIAFPPEIIGQGFFSRLLFIQADPTGKKITFPEPPNEQLKFEVISYLKEIRNKISGQMIVSQEAETALDVIYKSKYSLNDQRFEYYLSRRFSQLLKLCLILCASKLITTLTSDIVIEANTYLTYAEQFMPKALGSFGKSKYSDATHKITSVLNTTTEPLNLQDLWKYVHQDLNTVSELSEVVKNLLIADKIQHLDTGFISKKKTIESSMVGYVDKNYLTKEERDLSL